MMDANFQNLSAGIVDNLTTVLERAIVTLELAPAMRLTEEEIALRYGVSRSPVRDALRALERDGLVMRQARKGIWVSRMSLRDFDEVYRCRAALEALASEAAARSPLNDRKKQLKEVFDGMRTAHEARDADAFFAMDVRGSELIYKLADDTTLRRLISGLEKQALRYRLYLYKNASDLVRLSLDDTGAIFAAIEDGRAEDAKTLSENLITTIWQSSRATIEQHFGKG
ncbi:GntR family transcriptional regulator [Falsihalocynthiibacter arcticus]|uniref:HTH gntR-type domain-containing protein n=1 Tax=Falsihalocynthiibacter arcticus TaxID=1579316 RepID=A0A126UYB8_9RHOB|nr:GntR family transcriptional regulator [Falsihalocynthiibacter arcticus]AML50429.1 hypothetical protein RC74_03350 [Falsihalocynthiibacter arcticus]